MPVAKELEKNWTRFSPHYIVWVCPRVYRQSVECQSQCIHQGRYCTPDPDGDMENGYSGKDVVQVTPESIQDCGCCIYHSEASITMTTRMLHVMCCNKMQ